MAVCRYSPSAVMEYVGLAADTKPTADPGGNGQGPKPGDRFVESDTGFVYVFNSGAWTKVTGAVFNAGA